MHQGFPLVASSSSYVLTQQGLLDGLSHEETEEVKVGSLAVMSFDAAALIDIID